MVPGLDRPIEEDQYCMYIFRLIQFRCDDRLKLCWDSLN